MMLYHAVAEHLPKAVASELRQRGVDEQSLSLRKQGCKSAGCMIYTLFYTQSLIGENYTHSECL